MPGPLIMIQIHTHLPCAEEAYEQGQETPTMSLEDAMRPSNTQRLSPFAGVMVVASLFGRVILHLHRPDPDDRDGEINGEFWKRHRNLDNMLLSTALHLPPHLRLPVGWPDPNTIHLHMSLHAASICLHQVALFKAEKNQLPSDLIAESSVRCYTAAGEITRIMRMIAHTDLASVSLIIMLTSLGSYLTSLDEPFPSIQRFCCGSGFHPSHQKSTK